ncbi:hypothetical protein V5799_003258 [Amblyomma americanum]|uniref:Uncharacterized protein n=1 Tax=Amblyomma americanum TaxID=6943 RepID=A0AAQ4D9H0_AMBAM
MAAPSNHRTLFRDLTVRRGSFDLRPTATTWWIKDIALLGLAGWALSRAMDDERRRLTESQLLLPVSAADVAFRAAATLASGLLLGSLVCPRPAFFRRCFWAHAGCLPVDLALSVAFVLLKAEVEPTWKYASPWIQWASTRNSGGHGVILASVDELGGTGTRTEVFRRRRDAAKRRENQSVAVATSGAWSRVLSRKWNGHDRAAFSHDPALLAGLSITNNPNFPTSTMRRKQRATAGAPTSGDVAPGDNATNRTSPEVRGLQEDFAEPAAAEDGSRRADVVRGQLGAFLLADHVICLFARCYLLMRMRACLTALVIDEADADAINEYGVPLQCAVSPSATGDFVLAERG